MNALITLKTEKDILVEDLTVIKETYNGETTEITDFTSFVLWDCIYNFVGKNTVSVTGSDILAVNFY